MTFFKEFLPQSYCKIRYPFAKHFRGSFFGGKKLSEATRTAFFPRVKEKKQQKGKFSKHRTAD